MPNPGLSSEPFQTRRSRNWGAGAYPEKGKGAEEGTEAQVWWEVAKEALPGEKESWVGFMASTAPWEGAARWGWALLLGNRWEEKEKIVSSCARRNLDWILRKIPSLKVSQTLEQTTPGSGGVTIYPYFKNVYVWCLGTWFSERLWLDLMILRIVSNLNNSIVLPFLPCLLSFKKEYLYKYLREAIKSAFTWGQVKWVAVCSGC